MCHNVYESDEEVLDCVGAGDTTSCARLEEDNDVVTRKPRKSLIESMQGAGSSGAKGVTEVRVEVQIVSGANLVAKGSESPFCEVKLRTVNPRSRRVERDHPNPQKKTTKTVANNLSAPVFNEGFSFVVPLPDCIRVSVFGKKLLGKSFLGRVDLLSTELLQKGGVNGPPVTSVHMLAGDATQKDRSEVTGTLTVMTRIISVR